MKLVLSSVLAAAASVAFGQSQAPAPPKIPPPPSIKPPIPWSKAPESPLALAKGADQKVIALSGVQGQTVARYWIGDRYGWSTSQLKAKDKRTFKFDYEGIHYPAPSRKLPNGKVIVDIPALKRFVVANGREAMVSGSGMKNRKVPVVLFHLNQAKSVSDWVLSFPVSVLGGIHGEKPLTSLVQLAMSKPQEFRVTAGARSFPYQTTLIRQRNILIERTPAAAKRLGPIRIEFTIDVAHGLPVSARIDAHEKGKPAYTLTWMMHWQLRSQRFPASDFRLPGE